MSHCAAAAKSSFRNSAWSVACFPIEPSTCSFENPIIRHLYHYRQLSIVRNSRDRRKIRITFEVFHRFATTWKRCKPSLWYTSVKTVDFIHFFYCFQSIFQWWTIQRQQCATWQDCHLSRLYMFNHFTTRTISKRWSHMTFFMISWCKFWLLASMHARTQIW